jgi:hypothetical protein
MRWAGHAAHMRNEYKAVIVNPEEKRPLGTYRRR